MERLIRYSYYDRLREVYWLIVNYKLDNDGNSPGISHISRATGVVKSQIYHYLRVLEREGYINLIHAEGHAVQIAVTNGIWTLLEEPAT